MIGTRRRLARAAAACAAVLIALVPVSAQSPDDRFDAALAAYEQGRFGEAARGWADLARSGVRDFRVEYNLANALFKSGEIGEAILHWERARRLSPSDRDVRWNLQYARTTIVDRTPEIDRGAAFGWLRHVQDRVGPDRQAVVALALWWAIALVLAYALGRPGGFTARVAWTLAAVVLAATLVAGSWWWTWSRLHERGVAVVLVEVADVRAGPGENNAGLVQVHEGLTVRVRQRRDGWVQVELPDGLNGWIRADAIGVV